MRIPGWLVLVLSLGILVSGTAMCSFISYTTTRSLVIDARDSGVDVPELPDLIDYVFNGADDLGSESFEQQIAALPTPTPTVVQPPTNTPPPGVTFTPAPTATATVPATEDPLAIIPELNDPSRITVLLLGIDQRSALGDTGPFRTDTMMLAQIDPVRKTAGVLSIPRDLWVNIPGYEAARINTANLLGDRDSLPGGGPGLAMETVRANIGVPVDHFVRVNFDAFFGVVNTIAPNGIEVCVREEIIDPKYPDAGYGTIRVEFQPGCQVMDAERLLQYARTRATEGSDFDRARRQQEVLKALQAEVLNVGGVTQFITSIPDLYYRLAGSYQTNLSLEQILQLAQLVGQMNTDDITFNSINNLHVELATTEDGQQILIPRQNQIRFVVQETFNPRQDLTLADLADLAEREDASIVIYNNTDISGLAGNTRDWLTSRGVQVASVGNVEPPTNTDSITIRDYTGNPWTARYLAALLNLEQSAIEPGTDGLTANDVMIVVGRSAETLLSGQ